MSIKSKARNALPYSVAISVVNILVALFGIVLLVRHLEAKEYGIYALLNALPALFNMLLALGYDQYLARYVPSMTSGDTVRNTVWNIIFRRSVLVISFSILMTVGFSGYAQYFGLDGYFQHLSTYLVIVVFYIAHDLLKKSLLARFSQKTVLFNNIIHELGRITVIVYGVSIDAQLLFFIQGLVVVQTLSFSVLGIVFLRQYGVPPIMKILRPIKETKEEKDYRWGSYIDKLGGSFLGTDIDRYVLAYFSTNIQVAVYAIATRILSKVMDIYPNRMFLYLIQPVVYSRYDENKDDSQLNEAFRFLCSANNIIGFLLVAVFAPLGEELLLLVFDQEYVLQAYWPLLIFLGFLMLENMPLTIVAKAIQKPKILIISKAAFIFNIAVGIPLAYYYGAAGMAVATATSGTIRNGIIYILVNRHITLRMPWLAILKSILNAALTILAIVLLSQVIVGLVLFKAVFGVLIYLLLLKYNSVFTPSEAKLLISLTPPKFKKIAAALV